MKTIKRRLLSVLMVMAIVCTLIPTALAAGGSLSLGLGQSTTLTAEFSEGGFVPGGGSLGIGIAGFAYTSWSVSGNATLSNQNTGSSASAVVTAGMVPGTATVTATAYYYVFNGTIGGSTGSLNNVVALDSQQWTITIGGGVSGSYATISQSSMTLAQGGTGSLTVNAATGYELRNISWGTSNSSVVNVVGSGSNFATLTASTTGSASVYANFDVYYNNYYVGPGSVSCAVTVTNAIAISPSNVQVAVGQSSTLTASVAAGASTISWSVDKTGVIELTGSSTTATIKGLAAGTATVTASAMVNGVEQKAQCIVTVGNGTLALSASSKNLSLYGSDVLSAVSLNGQTIPSNVSISWSSNNTNVVTVSNAGTSGIYNDRSIAIYAKAPGQATITATAMQNGVAVATGSCVVTVASIQAKATVYSTENGFTLGSTNLKTPTSVVSQIASALSGYTGYGALQYVTFSNVTSTYGSLNASVNTPYSYSSYGGIGYYGNLSSITFTPSTTAVGSAVFNFTAYVTNGINSNPTGYPGTLTITVEKGSAGIDILYSTTVGKSIQINAQDFQSFWTKNVSSLGSLRYVVFGATSGNVGQLYYTNGTQSYAVGSQQFYYSPSVGQNSLSSVYFAPAAYGTSRTGTLAVPFTAYGTSNANGISTTTASGTMYICVTNGEVQNVNYQVTGSSVTLNPADFQTVYRQATGATQANPTIYIQFLTVPTYGSLYYNYKSGVFGGNGTRLTAANIGTLMFSNTYATTYGINDLTYIPGTSNLTDTVRYVAYSTNGGTPLYVGEITFGATAKAPIKYHCNSAGVTFGASDFFNSDSGLLSAQYITFGRPTSGTLYKNYSNGRGTAVSTTDRFSYYGTGTNASINTVTYVPASGYTGVVTIPYTGYTTTGGQISGSVKVYVVAKNFTDVSTTNWSYPYVTELAASGVVSGITPTVYGAREQVKWGEALKMVLLAAGYPAQSEGTGANWAANYLSYAYRNNLVSSSNINLNSSITRLEMAELAAKALKLSPATSIKAGIVAPTDTTNGYVYALYNAGIVGGDSSSGRNLYKPNSTLLRDEMAKIVCGIMDNAQ